MNLSEKVCKHCGLVSEFYASYPSKCKECVKAANVFRATGDWGTSKTILIFLLRQLIIL